MFVLQCVTLGITQSKVFESKLKLLVGQLLATAGVMTDGDSG